MERVDVTAVCNIQATGVVAVPGETVAVPRAEAEALVASGAAVWPSRPARAGVPEDALALERVKGIGPVTAGQLRAAGIADLRALAALEPGGERSQALDLAKEWVTAARALVSALEPQG